MDPVDLAVCRRRDPVRTAVIEAVYVDPPKPGGFLVAMYLASGALDYRLMRRDAATIGWLTIDAMEILRRRRAPANAGERAKQLGLRKAVYLELRGQVLRILRRVLAEGSGLRREPETSASRQTEIVQRLLARDSRGTRTSFTSPRTEGVSRDRKGAEPARGKATD